MALKLGCNSLLPNSFQLNLEVPITFFPTKMRLCFEEYNSIYVDCRSIKINFLDLFIYLKEKERRESLGEELKEGARESLRQTWH